MKKYIFPEAIVLSLGPAELICVSNVLRTLALSEMNGIDPVSGWDPED